MARREYTYSPICSHDGCNERAYYVYDTRREQAESMARIRETGWKCSRHSQPDTVLSVENPVRESSLVSYETDFGADPESRVYKLHRFWAAPENAAEERGGNGFAHGEGFKAWANDFPTGTRLIITARVELPEVDE